MYCTLSVYLFNNLLLLFFTTYSNAWILQRKMAAVLAKLMVGILPWISSLKTIPMGVP